MSIKEKHTQGNAVWYGFPGIYHTGILLITHPGQLYLTENIGLVKTWDIITALFSGICLVVLLSVLSMKKISLTINCEGITDYSSIAGVGLICWEDIRSVKEIRIQSKNFPHIAAHHPKIT